MDKTRSLPLDSKNSAVSGSPENVEALPRHLVITVHGIRTFGHWQERLEEITQKTDPTIVFYHYRFGYFSVLAFMFPSLRWLVTRRFQKRLLHITGLEDWSRIDIVAHSFGTHIVAWALYSLSKSQCPNIHTLILAGSVLRSGFAWEDLLPSYVSRLVNDCGIKDSILLLNQLVVLFTGMAGRIGFHGMMNRSFLNRYFTFGHSGYFVNNGSPDDSFMQRWWVPLLTSDLAMERHDERPSGATYGLLTFLSNNLEPIKISLYVLPLLFLVFYFYSLKSEAQRQQKIAQGRQLLAQADLTKHEAQRVRDQWADLMQRSLLLSIEGTRRLEDAGAAGLVDHHQALSNVARVLPRSVTRLHVDGNLSGVMLSLDGRYLFVKNDYDTWLLRNLETGAEIAKLLIEDLKNFINTADFSLFGARSRDGGLRVWRTNSGQELTLLTRTDGVAQAVLNSTGAYLGIVEDNDTIKVRRVNDGQEVMALKRKEKVRKIVFDSNASRLAVLADDGFLRIWKLPNPQTPVSIKLDEDKKFNIAAFSADGALIAVATYDDIVILNSQTGQELQRIKVFGADDEDDGITRINFSPDGKSIGALSDDGYPYLWSVATGDLTWPVVAVHDRFRDFWSFNYSNPEGTIVAREIPEGVEVWDALSGQEIARVRYTGDVDDVAFSPIAKTLAIADGDSNTVTLYDTNRGDQSISARFRGEVERASFDLNKNRLAICADNEASVWDFQNARKIFQLTTQSKPTSIALSPDGNTVAVWAGHILGVWRLDPDLATSVKLPSLEGVPTKEQSVDAQLDDYVGRSYLLINLEFSPHGKYLAAIKSGELKIWSTATGQLLLSIPSEQDVFSIDFRDDDLCAIVSRHSGANVLLWNLAEKREQARLPAPEDSPDPTLLSFVQFSPQGRYIVAKDMRKVFVWDVQSQQRWIEIVPLNGDRTGIVGISPSDRYLVLAGGTVPSSGTQEDIIEVWDLAKKQIIAKSTHENGVTGVAFSPDEKSIIAASLDQFFGKGYYSTRLLDIGTGKEIIRIPHQGKVNDLLYSSDGKYLSISGDDKFSRVWDVSNQGVVNEVARIEHSGDVYLTAFDKSNKYLISLDSEAKETSLQFSPLTMDELISRLRLYLERNFSLYEWNRFIGSEDYRLVDSSLPRPNN